MIHAPKIPRRTPRPPLWDLAFLCAFILCFSAAIPAPSAQPDRRPQNGDWLITQLNGEPSTLNPITSTDAYASNIDEYIYESLLRP